MSHKRIIAMPRKNKNLQGYTLQIRQLIEIYKEAELRIINAIGYKHKKRLVDYAEQTALSRAHEILQKLIGETYKRAPAAMTAQYLQG